MVPPDVLGASTAGWPAGRSAPCPDMAGAASALMSVTSNTSVAPGGMFGARGSRLIKLLRTEPGHYGVKLTAGDLARLAAWIDLNAVFYGAYGAEEQTRQLRGERIEMPEVQ